MEWDRWIVWHKYWAIIFPFIIINYSNIHEITMLIVVCNGSTMDGIDSVRGYDFHIFRLFQPSTVLNFASHTHTIYNYELYEKHFMCYLFGDELLKFQPMRKMIHTVLACSSWQVRPAFSIFNAVKRTRRQK